MVKGGREGLGEEGLTPLTFLVLDLLYFKNDYMKALQQIL